MKSPVSVKDIWESIPHRPPMVWVDEVHSYSDTGGETSVKIKTEGLYMSSKGGLRQSSCLEFIAQSYGFISICHMQFSGTPRAGAPKRAFLASFNEAKFASEEVMRSVKPGDEIRIEVLGARAMGPIILFQGKVRRGSDLLCETRMKVFSE